MCYLEKNAMTPNDFREKHDFSFSQNHDFQKKITNFVSDKQIETVSKNQRYGKQKLRASGGMGASTGHSTHMAACTNRLETLPR